MGMFLTGIWTTLIVGLWIYFISQANLDGIVPVTVLLLITSFILGAYIEHKTKGVIKWTTR